MPSGRGSSVGDTFEAMEEEFEAAIETVVTDCLGVGAGEEVLVVANPATSGLGVALRDRAAAVGAEASRPGASAGSAGAAAKSAALVEESTLALFKRRRQD